MKIGVIGCGYVFDHYMATWARHPGLALKGVADRNRARRDVVAEAYKLKAYASNEELLADPEIAIVVNLTSIDSHVEVTRAALLAGKHVYSEKPLAPDIAEARALIAEHLKRAFASGDLVISCGGIGATPDDHTRQAAALALGQDLALHPEAGS